MIVNYNFFPKGELYIGLNCTKTMRSPIAKEGPSSLLLQMCSS